MKSYSSFSKLYNGFHYLGSTFIVTKNSTNTYEVTVFEASINAFNNKIGFKNIISDRDIEEMIFVGRDTINMWFDGDFYKYN